MFFSDIFGQQQLKTKLAASVNSGRIPHAQLYSGPEGSGTLALAIAYARYVACIGEKGEDACGACSSCRKFDKLSHPDLHFSFPVNTTRNVKDPVSDDFIQQWRAFVLENPYFRANAWYNHIGLENKQGLINKKEGEAIVRKLSLKSYESRYKFMIIWLPEKMHVSVSNMLLKLIEEPPPNTVFLLVSEHPEQLLRTISSRTQPVRLEALKAEELKQAIGKKFDLPAPELESLVRLSNGNLITVFETLEHAEENRQNLTRFIDVMRMCWKAEYFEVNDWVEEMSGLGREQLKSFFEYACRLLRENFMMNLKKPELVYQTAAEEDFASKFHKFINERNILDFYEEFNRASADIERNGYAKIILFDLCLRMMKLIRK
ncbi:MAG: DNA polymerase III subunit delta [Bacteroidales bacterium]|nr:DNA polymerase III subunit delta [Bacteroidales bacterium]